MFLYAEDKETVLAEYEATRDNKLKIKFNDAFNAEPYDRGGFFEVKASFNGQAIKDGEDNEFVFQKDLDKTETIILKAKENKINYNLDLNKSGSFNKETKEIEWQINLTPLITSEYESDKLYIKDLKIEDKLGLDQTYIDESFSFQDKNIKVQMNEDKTSFTHEIGEELKSGETYVLSYKTKPNLLSGRTDFANEIEVENDKIGKKAVKETVEVKFNYLEKSGKYIGDKTIKWEIKINPDKLDLSDVKLQDKLGEGLAYKEETLKINYKSEKDYTIVNKFDNPKEELSIDLKNIDDEVTVVYETFVEDSAAFNSNNSKEYSNSASLNFQGLEKEIKKEIGVGVPTSILSKRGVKYNPSNHTMDWEIIVNENEIEIENAVFKDIINEDQEYVAGSFRVDGEVVVPTIVKKEISHKLGDINKSIKITLQTKLIDNKDYALNGYKYAYNTASLEGQGIEFTEVKDYNYVYSEVLSKSYLSYDSTNNTIEWELKINENKMPLTGVEIIDTIKSLDGKDLPDNSPITILEDEIIVEGPDKDLISYEVKGTNLLIKADKLSSTNTIRYKTKIDTNYMSQGKLYFAKNKSSSIKNEALIKAQEMPKEGQKVEESVTIEFPLLNKFGSYNEEEASIDWHVVLNEAELNLGEITIKDELPEGLILDYKSISLVDRKTQETIKPMSIDYKADKNVLEIKVDLSDKRSYDLKYSTDIDVEKVNGEEVTNKISLNGGVMASIATEAKVAFSIDSINAGIHMQKRGSVELLKTDGDDENIKLEGAVFGLYNEDKLLIRNFDATNQDGTSKIKGLRPGKYFIKELKAPEGYELYEKEHEINISLEKGQKDIYFEIKNDRIKSDVKFKKVSSIDNKPIDGVQFSLILNGDIKYVATSDENGWVEFNDVEYGEYILKEDSTPVGYLPLDENIELKVSVKEKDKFTVIANQEGIVVDLNEEGYRIVNQAIVGSLKIIKVDSEDQEKTLEGAMFEISSENGAIKEKKMTDINGELIFENLEFGKYYYKEIKAPNGYEIDEKRYEIEIKEDGRIVELIIENTLKPVEPTEPETPNKPKPVEPTDPETPNKPKPVEPTDPETSNKPEPIEPTDPETPNKPKPVEPTEPENPSLIEPEDEGILPDIKEPIEKDDSVKDNHYTSEAPKTGDMGVTIYLVVALIGIVFLKTISKKSKYKF